MAHRPPKEILAELAKLEAEIQHGMKELIDFQVEYVQSLIDSFSIASKPPHIAISVDMLERAPQ